VLIENAQLFQDQKTSQTDSADYSGVARGGGVWGVQTPSIEKGVHFYCLVIEQNNG